MGIIVITDNTFEEEVLKSDVPVIVDFFATWCGPCQAQTPILEQLSEKLDGKVKVVKLDVDQNPTVAQKFSIMSIPTLKLFNKGQETQSFVGMTRADVLESAVENLL